MPQRDEVVQNPEALKQAHESLLTQSMEEELSDEQLQQLAEGSCSWGANCNSQGSC